MAARKAEIEIYIFLKSFVVTCKFFVEYTVSLHQGEGNVRITTSPHPQHTNHNHTHLQKKIHQMTINEDRVHLLEHDRVLVVNTSSFWENQERVLVWLLNMVTQPDNAIL